MEDVKTKIIKLKLDLLFQLKDEDYVVNKFEQLKNKLQSLSKKLDKLQTTYKEKITHLLLNERTKKPMMNMKKK